MEIKVTEWKLKTNAEGNREISGSYCVMLGNKEVAKQSFNSDYGSMKIGFTRETMDAVAAIGEKIVEEIKTSFN